MIHTVIVEDDPMVAQIDREYLERFDGFHVDRLFGNGADALQYIRENPVDLAILDQFLPVLSGNEVLRGMRAAGIHTSVIMITSAAEANTVEESLQYGVVDYLIKPFSLSRFEEAIARFQAMTRLLKSRPVVDQAMVDQILKSAQAAPPAAHAMELDKGLNERTMAHIYNYLREHPSEKHTCKSISDAVNLSKVTVRRYLNFLIESDQLLSSIDYETGGRPRVLYRLKSRA